MTRAALLRWLRLTVGLGLLALLLARVDLVELRSLARHGDPLQLLLGLSLLFAANPLVQTLRLHVLVARYTQTLATSFKVFVVGSFFNTMLPSNVGGDAVKLLYLKRMRAETWGGPFALLMLHRATGMLVLLVGAAAHAALNRERLVAALHAARVETHLPLNALALAGLLVLALGIGWLSLAGNIRARVAAVLRSFLAECAEALAQVGPRALGALAFWTLAFHFMRMLAFYTLVRYAGQHIELWDLLIVLAATAVAGVMPISVGGLGLMEGAISMMLALFGVSESAGIVAALANRLVLLAGAALGGLVYLTDRGGPKA
jgi:uncharacterized membrane protein YbhN (UPF0104 family)